MLFAVPEDETDGDIRPDVGQGEDSGELQGHGRSGGVVVRAAAGAAAIQVAGDDIHLVRMHGADLGGIQVGHRQAAIAAGVNLRGIALSLIHI